MSVSGFDWDAYREAQRERYANDKKIGDELERAIREYARQIAAVRSAAQARMVRHERVAHQVKAMIRAAGARPWGEK